MQTKKNIGTRQKPKSYTPEERVEKRARQAARAIAAHGETEANLVRLLAAGEASRQIAYQYMTKAQAATYIESFDYAKKREREEKEAAALAEVLNVPVETITEPKPEEAAA